MEEIHMLRKAYLPSTGICSIQIGSEDHTDFQPEGIVDTSPKVKEVGE
jgi:hypothetical protein